jgi:hypothetical protein
MLGGSVAAAPNRSINTLPSTTSPTNTTKQTKSMLSSKATRRRPLPSEPEATPSRRRVRRFHARPLCSSIGTVVSIRNVASAQTRLNVMFRVASTYRAEKVESKIRADESDSVCDGRASRPEQGVAFRHFGSASYEAACVSCSTATFYTTGMEHSPTSTTGTASKRTPLHAVQSAAWETLKKARHDD